MKQIKKRIIKGIMIVIALVVLYVLEETVAFFLYPQNGITQNWASFYAQEKDTVDILIVGSSHAYASINPYMIEEKTGKNAYILAGNSQNVTQTYYNVKEVLRTQKPEVIVLEAFAINNNDNWQKHNEGEFDRNWKKSSNIDSMRFGLPKIQAVLAQYKPHNWLYGMTKLPKAHANWADVNLILDNYQRCKEKTDDFGIFRPSASVMSEETKAKYAKGKKNKNSYQVCEVNKTHFRKLAKLCRENGIQLYVTMAPFYDKYTKRINYESWYEQIDQLTKEAGVTYLDGNKEYDLIGMIAEDFEDAYNSYHHLNEAGAAKFTKYLLEAWEW